MRTVTHDTPISAAPIAGVAETTPAWRWLAVGWCTAFLVGIDLFVVAPLLPAIGTELGLPPASLAVLVTAFGIAYAVTCPLVGLAAERAGARRVLCLGVAALGLANLYTAFAPDLPQLVASRWLAGMAAASTTPMLYALAAERAHPSRRAVSLALVNSGLVLALVGGAPLGLLWGGVSGWRGVLAALGVLFLLSLPLQLATWRGAQRGAPAARVPCPEFWRHAPAILACTALWSASVYASYTLLATAVQHEFGWGTTPVAIALAAFGIGATAGGLAGGRLADRWGARRFVRHTLAAMCACFALAALLYGVDGPGALACSLLLVALASYGFFPALQAHASAVLPARRKTILGFMSSALYVGIAGGASAGAAVYSAAGFRTVLLASAGCALLALLLASRLSRPLDQ